MQLAAQALGHQRLAGGSCRHTNRLGTPVFAFRSPSSSTKASEVRSAPSSRLSGYLTKISSRSL
jgi:hypothetical protein